MRPAACPESNSAEASAACPAFLGSRCALLHAVVAPCFVPQLFPEPEDDEEEDEGMGAEEEMGEDQGSVGGE